MRVSGKRTLAQLNAFDFIVTVAFGSTLATVALSSSVAWVEGALALALLAALQFVVAWAAVHMSWFRRAVTSAPTVLVRDGRPVHSALVGQRISEESLNQIVRSAGIGGLELVAAVVLESNGKISVVPDSQLGSGSAIPGEGAGRSRVETRRVQPNFRFSRASSSSRAACDGRRP